MVFTPEQDGFILMAHFRSATRNEGGVWTYSLDSCIEQFQENFPDENIDRQYFTNYKNAIVRRFENKHCICKGKSTGRPKDLTEEVLDDIRDRMETSPKKSLRKLAAQTGLSLGTVHKAVKKELHMYPYKVTMVQQLIPADYDRRLQYCHWFNEQLAQNNDVLDLTFFTDEAWFHLSGFVNSQNYRTWATENPHEIIETPLHPLKVGVWVGISRRRIIGPIFFDDTINAERYRTNILQEFLQLVDENELTNGYFQQDGAPAHTAAETMRFLRQVYGDRVISQGLWPPRSPDLTPPDFYLFGHLKNKIFMNRIHTLEELRNAITRQINEIPQEMLQRVFDNMKRRINLCIEHEGHHFQQFL